MANKSVIQLTEEQIQKPFLGQRQEEKKDIQNVNVSI